MVRLRDGEVEDREVEGWRGGGMVRWRMGW